MAYDEDLADRIRDELGGQPGVTEQVMFGGLAFLVDRKMAIATSGVAGGVLVRVDPADAERLIGSTHAEMAVMGERHMRGWLRVDPEHLWTRRQLAAWVKRGVDRARSLPAKQSPAKQSPGKAQRRRAI